MSKSVFTIRCVDGDILMDKKMMDNQENIPPGLFVEHEMKMILPIVGWRITGKSIVNALTIEQRLVSLMLCEYIGTEEIINTIDQSLIAICNDNKLELHEIAILVLNCMNLNIAPAFYSFAIEKIISEWKSYHHSICRDVRYENKYCCRHTPGLLCKYSVLCCKHRSSIPRWVQKQPKFQYLNNIVNMFPDTLRKILIS